MRKKHIEEKLPLIEWLEQKLKESIKNDDYRAISEYKKHLEIAKENEKLK